MISVQGQLVNFVKAYVTIVGGFLYRHFVKEDLPRICYANHDLSVQVRKVAKPPAENWKSEMTLGFGAFQHLLLDFRD